jgi:hypothetical protein
MSQPVVIQLTQETVDRMVQGLASQGWNRSADPEHGRCFYVNGLRRCAVGWMVKEEEAKALPNNMVERLVKDGFLKVEGDVKALAHLQIAHDESPDQFSMRWAVQQWCQRYGFDFNEYEEPFK